jgi:hypothetical protein
MTDIFDELDDVKEELEAEWQAFISVERANHIRKATEEFDASIAPKKRAWTKNRLLKRIQEISVIDTSPIARERERHLPVGTRMLLRKIPVGGSELFQSPDREVIQAIRSCAYSLADEQIVLKTETTNSDTGIILSVVRAEA